MKTNACKITLLGDSTVGKTSLTIRIRDDEFYERIGSTIGAAYSLFKIKDKTVEFWDTAGQERFLALVTMYYRDADIILMVYDITKPETLSKLHMYISKIRDDIDNECKLIIVGNKSDLVSPNEAKRIMNKVKKDFEMYNRSFDISHCTVSSKTGNGIENLTNIIYELCDEVSNNDENSDILKLFDNGNTGILSNIPGCGC